MKILVIGNGFLGSSIIHRLESEGHELLVFSRTYKSGISAQQIIGDIFAPEKLNQILSWQPQIIIHTAWITTHHVYAEDSSNVQYAKFTADLAELVSRRNLEHLIILGSCAEYGQQSTPSTAGVTELNPDSLYAEQKVFALHSVKESLVGTNIRLTWARIFQPYGKNQDKNRLLPYLIDSINSGKQVKLNDTVSILDWITTRDIASAISWILKNDMPVEVDFGTGIGFTNLELLRQIEALLGNSNQWEKLVSQPNVHNRVVQVGKDSPLFVSGWYPNDSLVSGLQWVLGK
jgi:nucleoside-diphosphate-sugar epimerase